MPHKEDIHTGLGKRIGTNLRAARRRAGIGTKELARKCKVSPRTLRYYETGGRNKFEGIVILLRAAEALGIEFTDFMRNISSSSEE